MNLLIIVVYHGGLHGYVVLKERGVEVEGKIILNSLLTLLLVYLADMQEILFLH